MAKFTFNKKTINYEDQKLTVSGNGSASVKVDGYYTYDPGNYWNPPESDYEINGVEIEEIDDIEIEEIEDISDEYYETLINDQNFLDTVCEQLELDDEDFDEDDLVDVLIEQEEDAYEAYCDDYDEDR